MSLKGFHILFIIFAFLCSAGFWAWATMDYERAADLGVVTLGNLSGSLAVLLFIYGLWFAIVKSRTIRI
jgi:hypothetical protein